MNTQARMIIGALGALGVALAVTLGAVIAMDDDDGTMAGRGHMNTDDSYAGMMQSMGDMDSNAMLSHMQEVLGTDGYQRMMDHLNDHRNGGPMTADPNVDQMMHSMMDGMMQHMPADADNIMPPGRDEHHETPATDSTPQS
ncbi:MAG: hypothetical protein WEC75_09365 [Dehalococcoidia bacterium]